MRKALGAALLVAGIVMLVFGFNEYQSLSSDIAELFTGSPTDRAIGLLVAGAAATAAGLVLLVRPAKTE